MTAMSLMMMTSKITLPTTAIATRYSTRYSNFLLLLDSNSTRRGLLITRWCCFSVTITATQVTSYNGRCWLCGGEMMLPIQIIVIIAFTSAWETDTERVRICFFLKIVWMWQRWRFSLHNSTLGLQVDDISTKKTKMHKWPSGWWCVTAMSQTAVPA